MVSKPLSTPSADVLVAEEVVVQQPVMPAAAETTSNAFKPAYGQMVRVNGLKAVYARKGDTPLEYAYKTSMRYQKLLELNEIDERPLPNDMYPVSYTHLDVYKRQPIGGFILADNVLYNGEVVLPDAEQSKNAKAMHAFNEKVKADQRVEHVLLPVRDGIMMVRKIKN